jgi:hypothetical protein
MASRARTSTPFHVQRRRAGIRPGSPSSALLQHRFARQAGRRRVARRRATRRRPPQPRPGTAGLAGRHPVGALPELHAISVFGPKRVASAGFLRVTGDCASRGQGPDSSVGVCFLRRARGPRPRADAPLVCHPLVRPQQAQGLRPHRHRPRRLPSYWTFDARVHARWTAESGYVLQRPRPSGTPTATCRTRQVQRIRWEPSAGEVDHFFDDELVSGSKGVRADLLAKIEPFPTTKDLKPYDPGHSPAGWSSSTRSTSSPPPNDRGR